MDQGQESNMINTIEITEDNEQEFIVKNGLDLPVIITPGTSWDLTLEFYPISEGSKEAYFSVNGLKIAKLIGTAY